LYIITLRTFVIQLSFASLRNRYIIPAVVILHVTAKYRQQIQHIT